MNAERAIELAAQGGMAAAGVLAAVVGAALPLAPILLPLLLARIGNAKARTAAESVTRAALPAVTAATVEIHRMLEAARKPDSPGGTAVTDDERKAALAIGVAKGLSVLKDQGPALMRVVVEYYGSEEAVRQALEVLVRRKALGDRLDVPRIEAATLEAFVPSPTTTPTG